MVDQALSLWFTLYPGHSRQTYIYFAPVGTWNEHKFCLYFLYADWLRVNLVFSGGMQYNVINHKL